MGKLMKKVYNHKILNCWLESTTLSTKDLESIQQYTESELFESFHKHVEFGTGGIRSKMGIGSNLLNIYTISRITFGISNFLTSHHKKKVALGYDTRNNSFLFASVVTNILMNRGIEVYSFETFIPTPLLSFTVQNLNLDLGIMITASHNPPIYNGYKIYDQHGCQLVPQQALEIKKFVDKLPDFVAPIKENFKPQYVDYVKRSYLSMISSLGSLDAKKPKKLKVAYSSLHGTGYELAKKIIQYNHDFLEVPLECTPDGNFTHVKSSNPEDEHSFDGMRKLFKTHPFDIGFATDPDADRLGVIVNHEGTLISLTGNQVGALLTKYLSNKTHVSNSFIATTIVSSDLAKNIARSKNIQVVETLTGFKYIGEQIEINKDKTFLFGYEESFGFLINNEVRDKDAFQPIPLLLDYVSKLKKENKTLIDELEYIFKEYGYFKDELITFTFEGIEGQKKILKTIDELSNTKLGLFHGLTIKMIENYQTLTRTTSISTEPLNLEKSDVIKFLFKEGGWVVFRPSGTEPKLKIYLSLVGESQNEVLKRFKLFKERLLRSL
jgi:phosphoglucomutase